MIADALTAEYARERLDYDPDTGILRWKPVQCAATDRNWRSWNGKNAGKAAGSINGCGYRMLSINGRSYQSHRVAWLIQIGEWPSEFVDHINGDKDDNRWVNLRAATCSQNTGNRRRKTGSRLKYRGVRKHGNKWQATFNAKYLGLYETERAAAIAYNAEAKRHWGEYARLNEVAA